MEEQFRIDKNTFVSAFFPKTKKGEYALKFVAIDVQDLSTYPPEGKALLFRDFTGNLYIGRLEQVRDKDGVPAGRYFFRELTRYPFAAPVAWAELPTFPPTLTAHAGQGLTRNCKICRHFQPTKKCTLNAIIAGIHREVKTCGTCGIDGSHVMDEKFGCDKWELRRETRKSKKKLRSK